MQRAEFLLEQEIPALYRVHEIPKSKKLEALHGFLGELGLNLGGGETPTAKDYANLIEKVKDREDAHLIETVLLRSMQLAVYSEKKYGPFWVGLPSLCSFYFSHQALS